MQVFDVERIEAHDGRRKRVGGHRVGARHHEVAADHLVRPFVAVLGILQPANTIENIEIRRVKRSEVHNEGIDAVLQPVLCVQVYIPELALDGISFARRRAHIALHAPRGAALVVDFHHRHVHQVVAAGNGFRDEIVRALAEAAHAVGPARDLDPAHLSRGVANGIVGQIDIVEFLIRKALAQVAQHGAERAAEAGEVFGSPVEGDGVPAHSALRNDVVLQRIAERPVAAAFGHGDAAGLGVPRHVFENRARHPQVGDVAGPVSRLRPQENDVGLDHHPGARLHLHAAAVVDGRPYHVAHPFVVQRMFGGRGVCQLGMVRTHQAYASLRGGDPEERQRGCGAQKLTAVDLAHSSVIQQDLKLCCVFLHEPTTIPWSRGSRHRRGPAKAG